METLKDFAAGLGLMVVVGIILGAVLFGLSISFKAVAIGVCVVLGILIATLLGAIIRNTV